MATQDPSAPSAGPRDAGETGEAGTDEPGAPIPEDAIDPELLRLPPPRARRSPLLALSVLVLGVVLLVRLRADLAYSLQPSTPAALGDVRTGTGLAPGRHVSLAGTGAGAGLPDYRNALAFEARGEQTRTYLFRLLGTGSRLFVVLGADGKAAGPGGLLSGRLRRFADLPYAATVQDYYQKKVRATRALDLAALRALPDGALAASRTLPDRAGEMITLAPEMEILIDVLFPDDVRVLLARDKFPSEPDALHEVLRLKLPAGPGIETQDGFGYVLRLPTDAGARNRAVAQIDAQGMLLWHRVEVYRVPASLLQKGPLGLSLPGPDRLQQPTRYGTGEGQGGAAPQGLVPANARAGEATLLPWADIQAVQISEPLSVPGDALVLLAGESPSAVWWTLPIAALLVLFMGFNLWYLGRSFSEWRQGT